MRKRNPKSAFTLIELLVVVSIILIASSVIFIGSGGGDGAKLSSAQRIVSGIAQGARGQAILKNARTRLIIYSDDNAGESGDPDKILRFFGIVYEELERDASGNVVASGWRAATQGTYLPEGIYFNKDLSQGWPDSSMSLEYPRATRQAEGSGDSYYYYEFQSNGNIAPNFRNTWLALQAGILRGAPLDVVFPESEADENFNLKTALIFRRAGTTTPVNDPIDID